MFVIYEPFLMYSTNIEDFWFDLKILMESMFACLLIGFSILSIFYTVVYLVNKKFFPNKNIYNIVLVVSMIAFFATYIQGNYLTGNLPVLSGDEIVWSGFIVDNIITIVIWVVLITAFVFFIRKYKFEKVIKTSTFVTVGILLMLCVAMIPNLFKEGVFSEKKINDITREGINYASVDQNLFIMVLDTIDSRTFNEALNDSQYKDMFTDFTYYPDTLAGYPFTRDSVPLILTGKWNDNQKSFLDFYQDAVNSSPLFEKLEQDNFDSYIYEADYILSLDRKWDFKNFKEAHYGNKKVCIVKNEAKYVLFKYLPFFAKKASRINELDFYYCMFQSDQDVFKWNDINAYDNYLNDNIEKIDNKYFHYIHLEGAHTPFDLNENLEEIENGDYYQKMKASIKVIDAFIKRLKENGVYDNSAIVILADHGYEPINNSVMGRENPILYIKGIGEHHKMITSDKPISYEDLMGVFMDLIDGKKSTEMFKDIPKNRERKYIYYVYGKEDEMTLYTQKDKAWEYGKMNKTDTVYKR
jgi:hypothetical protein